MTRQRTLVTAVTIVAAAVLSLLLILTRSVDRDARLDVLATFKDLEALDATRDRELLSLRFGLSRNYDTLRELSTSLEDAAQRSSKSADLLDAKGQRELLPLLLAMQSLIDHQDQLIEDFVSTTATLNNSLRGLAKTAHLASVESSGELGPALRHSLDRLQSSVFQYSLTPEPSLASEARQVAGELKSLVATMDADLRDKVETVLFQAEIVLAQQVEVDQGLRDILHLGSSEAIRAALECYVGHYDRLEDHARAVRWWLYAFCILLLASLGVTIVQLKGLQSTIEHKVVERTRELEASREQYRSLVERTHVVPWQWDPERELFLYVGPQGAELLGCSVEDWLAPGFWRERAHPEDRVAVHERFVSIANRAADTQFEFRMKRNDGEWVWVRSILSGERDGKPNGIVQGFMLDVTEHRRIEFELQQAQKLESVGRLAAGIAHEINTPVQFVSDSVHFVRDASVDLFVLLQKLMAVQRAVQGGQPSVAASAQAAEAEENADLAYLMDNVPKALDRSLEGLARVATIVRSMKEFAHPDQKEMSGVDLNRAIESTLTIARNEYKYVAEVETHFCELPLVTCHAGDINQAVLNIVVNAAHAIGDKVSGTDAKGRISVRTQRDGEHVVVTIEDTGGGIPLEVRPKIFEPFFTTKEVGKGTGQGLAIARSVVVEKHGGELSFESEIGKGTTFVIRLPIHGKVRERAKAAA